MKGARELAELFSTGQHGRLFLSSGRHGRGRTFHIYVLPADEVAISNGDGNAPLNAGAVEVFGVVAGVPGWTESYGWLHSGKWQEDFSALAAAKREERAKALEAKELAEQAAKKARQAREASVLASC